MINVSVIIPSYNYGKFIGRAIRSALQQTYPKSQYEIIVVDDCSSDNSLDIIKAFGNQIKLIQMPKNCGLSAVRNIGLMNARGKFVTFLDADDCLNKHFLQTCMLNAEFNENIKTVATEIFVIADNDEHICRLSWNDYDIIGGAIYNLESVFACGLFDETKSTDEDTDFLSRYFALTNPKENSYINLPLYRYRWHENNMSKGRDLWLKEDIQNFTKSCTQDLSWAL